MMQLRPAAARGHLNFGWLDTHHTFSFGDYFDPAHMQFRALRVINDDRIAGHAGFPTHPHRDMEIITYILQGGLAHKDSMGNGSVIAPGDVQRMSAGTGVTHSEHNASADETHLLQIWLLPEAQGLAPSYEQTHFTEAERTNQLRLVASRDGREGSVTVHQDVALYAAILEPGHAATHEIGADRHAWIQVARGSLEVNGMPLATGDGLAVSEESALRITAIEESEVLLFDLA